MSKLNRKSTRTTNKHSSMFSKEDTKSPRRSVVCSRKLKSYSSLKRMKMKRDYSKPKQENVVSLKQLILLTKRSLRLI